MAISLHLSFACVLGITIGVAACSSDPADPTPPVGGSAAPGTCGSDAPVYVAFRLDDLQADVQNANSQRVSDVFLDRKVRLTTGIITRFFTAGFGATEVAIGNAQKAAGNELANHTVSHEISLASTEAEIIAEVGPAQTDIDTVWGVTPVTYIVPHYEYGEATIDAMKGLPPLSIVSGRCAWSHGSTTAEHPKYCLPDDDVTVAGGIVQEGIARLPAGAVLGCDADYFDAWGADVSTECALGWMDAQLENQSFSVLVLHPQEFTSEDHWTALDGVLDHAEANWCPLTLDALRQALQ